MKKIEILCPITSRGCPGPVDEQPIFKSLIPSANALCMFGRMGLTLGYDSGDRVWSDPEARERVSGKWVELFALGGNITAIFNAVAAANDWDYAIPANDDLAFQTNPIVAVSILKSRGGFGTVAFFDHAFPNLPTFYMVGRTHMDIFGVLYPLNWTGAHQDSWIHDVYRPWRASEICHDIQVHNHIGAATRFEYGEAPGYRERVLWGRRKVNEWLRSHTVAPVLDEATLESTPTIIP